MTRRQSFSRASVRERFDLVTMISTEHFANTTPIEGSTSKHSWLLHITAITDHNIEENIDHNIDENIITKCREI